MSLNYQSHIQNNRPHSSLTMTDLSIYVVPLDLWDEQQNLALNEIINETISAGFIRVEPEQCLSDLRFQIDQQLGYDFIPKDYVFCKSVGRCLAQVREKQENFLKVKHFLPPNSYAPELFVVDSIVSKRSQMTSDSNKTYDSLVGSEMRIGRGTSNKSLQLERFSHEQELERQRLEDKNYARIRQREIENAKEEKENNLEIMQIEMITEEESKPLDTTRKFEDKGKEFNIMKLALKPSNDPGLESRRYEIENLQKEIMKKYQELDELENKHRKKITEWENEEKCRKQEEEERRRLFEEMEAERLRQEKAIIDNQKEELRKLEEILKVRQIEIHQTEEQLELERNKREEMKEIKKKEMEELNVRVEESIKPDSEIHDQILKLHEELEEMDKKQKDLEKTTKLEREQAALDFEKARIEFERLKNKWEEEKRLRESENSERLLEEERLRELYEQRQREHAQRMEEERNKMIEERERFNEKQKQWEEERLRFEEEEKKRLEEMEKAIQDANNNKPIVPKFELNYPDLILEGASESDQKNHLKKILKTLKTERDLEEKTRDQVIRKIRDMQMKVQNRRNNLKDVWKKKYLDEKKKSPPLEDQLNRYKEELESLHRKLMNSVETGMKDQRMLAKHPGTLTPSNKANLILEAFRIQHDIEDVRQKIEFSQMRLSAERKLRAQTETELKMLKIEAMQKKIRLSRTRSDQLAIQPHAQSSDFIYSPHTHSSTNGSTSTLEALSP